MPALLAVIALLALGFYALRTIRRGRQDAPGAARLTEQLTDPREAAAILLVQQAAYEGRVTPAHKQAILTLMTATFGVDEDEAAGLYGFGRMAVGQTGDAANNLRRLLAPVRAQCTLAEMKDLAAMLVQVGETGGAMNDAQARLTSEVRRALSLPPTDDARQDNA